MKKSKFTGFIIDCKTKDLKAAAVFWSEALNLDIVGQDGPGYIRLDGRELGLNIEVQAVDHESRVHLDIAAEDVEAEATRLETLGAKRIKKINSWWVMEAPTGQRFCIVRKPGES